MKTTITHLAILAAVALIAVSAITFIVAKTKNVHSVRVVDGMLELETSPDGRMANPYRDTISTAVGPIVALGIAAILGLTIVMFAVGWAIAAINRRPTEHYESERRTPEN